MKTHTHFHPQLLLRTPAFPQKETLSLKDIKEWTEKLEFQEAIYLASPGLYQRLQRYLKNELPKEKENALFQTLYKYGIRSCNRSTPFGLFAGYSVVNWGEETALQLPLPEEAQRKTYLHFSWLVKLARQLEKIPAIRHALSYDPNSTIRYEKDKIIFIIRSATDNAPGYLTAGLDDYLSFVLKKAEGSPSFPQLVQALKAFDPELSIEETKAYLEELINAQILVSELQPVLTGPPYLSHMLKVLDRLTETVPGIAALLKHLSGLEKKMLDLDMAAINSVRNYEEIIRYAGQLNLQQNYFDSLTIWNRESLSDFSEKPLFQTNLHKKPAKTIYLNRRLQKELLEAIHVLDALFPKKESDPLKQFARHFYARYETRAVPLLMALDPERGLGYPIGSVYLPDELLEGFQFAQYAKDNQPNWTTNTSFLFKLLKANVASGDYTIDLSKDLMFKNPFTRPLSDWRHSIQVVFSLPGREESKTQILLKGVGASTGIYMASRFTGGSAEIAQVVKDVVAVESQYCRENEILAEIVFLPDEKAGNLLMRPQTRAFEIPYLTQSSRPKNQQIPLSDLLLSVDSRTQQFKLTSKTLNKIIIPKLSTPHNYHASPHPVYRFLGDLQYQETKIELQFGWGALSDQFHFFPRVCYKNVILSRASWILKAADFKRILVYDPSKIKTWQKEWKLPDLFVLVEGDKELLIHLKNPLAVQSFIQLIKKRRQIKLYEHLFDNNTCPIQDSSGQVYENEFIATLFIEDKGKEKSESGVMEAPIQVVRTYPPGSEWLYYKIYCGFNFADKLLTQFIHPLVKKYETEKIIDQWFFIRYDEGGFHIRFRVYFKELSRLGTFMRQFNQLMTAPLEEGLIWKIQTDTYQRDLERYGWETIGLAEEIFHEDSQSILSILKNIQVSRQESFRWQFAMLSIDQYLEDFSFTAQEKTDFMSFLKTYMGKEMGLNNKTSRRLLNDKYRKYRPEINLLFEGRHVNDAVLRKVLTARSEKLKLTIEKLSSHFQKAANWRENRSFQRILSSYLHMHINRLFKNRHLYNEFMLYYLLERHYVSFRARRKI